MNAKNACLFGGALATAGLSAAAAAAPEFVILSSAYNAAYGNTYDTTSVVGAGYYDAFGYGLTAVTPAYFGDDLNVSVSAYGTTSTNTVTDTMFRTETVWDGSSGYGGYGAAQLTAAFEVTEDGSVDVSWDFTATDYFSVSLLAFAEPGGGANELIFTAISALNPTGTFSFDVDAGVTYLLVLDGGIPFIFSVDTPVFFEAVLVPTPGAMGVAALGGVMAARRRRR